MSHVSTYNGRSVRILVSGSSGKVGREVVTALRRLGADVRQTSRVEKPDSTCLDFLDPGTYMTALDGVSAVFLMRPPAITDIDATLGEFINVAEQLGNLPVCFLSVAGAGSNPLLPHRAVERRLIASKLAWTILRPGFFAQNFSDAYRQDIVEDGQILVPAGDAKVAFIDTRDIAEVAALALMQPSMHARKTYELTGPKSFTFSDCAGILSSVLDRRVRYVPASIVGYVRHLRRRRLPWPQTLVQTALHVGLRFGQAEAVDPTLVGLLGRARTVEDYLRDHANLWRTP